MSAKLSRNLTLVVPTATIQLPFLEAGRNDFAVVEYKNIQRDEIVDDVAKVPVFDGLRLCVHDHEPRAITRSLWFLRDAPLRQLKVKVGEE